MYSAGDVKFYERAYFLENGQYEQDGLEVWNQPGGAILSIGTMEVSKNEDLHRDRVIDLDRIDGLNVI